jgi:putative membrane protein
MHLNWGRRVLKHSLLFTTTIFTCAALQAEDHEKHGNKAEKFIQKAAKSGQMEVKMGQLAQQKGQAAEVKSLGSALVRDHSAANQKLQQLAKAQNIRLEDHTPSTDVTRRDSTDVSAREHAKADADKHAKHQQAMDDLQNQSGAEFDKAFVKMAIKHHKKDVKEFEQARSEVNDPQLKAFIDETLPKLRNHLQMAQSAARTVGVDESTIAADVDVDSDSGALGAPATGTRGSDKPSSPASNPDANKNRSSFDQNNRFDGATQTDASGTIENNNPRANLDANIGDKEISADADIDRTDDGIVADVDADVDTDDDGKLFQKGDGKVLGLPTDKNDGKFLGIIPNPRANNNDDVDVDVDDDASIDTEVNVDRDETSVGTSATSETGSSSKSDKK